MRTIFRSQLFSHIVWLSFVLIASFPATVGAGYAACPGIIVSGETQTASQTLADDESCSIQSGGSLITSFENGIQADDRTVIVNSGSITVNGHIDAGIIALDFARITNYGDITSNGYLALGMGAYDNATLTNRGLITVTGNESIGIHAEDDSVILNFGTIEATGDDVDGIFADDKNEITNRGSITVDGEDAAAINVLDTNIVQNSGTIKASGEDAIGILAEDYNTITNAGTIQIDGEDSSAIYVESSNEVVNSGRIETKQDFAEGIETDGSNNKVSNSGTISTVGTGSDAIELDGNFNIAINTGTITTSGDFAEGVDLNSDDTFTNSGTIRTSGSHSEGVDGYNRNTLTNSGSIFATGEHADGVMLESDNKVFNSGTISATGTDGNAINFTDDNNQLILLPGSIIIGELLFDEATNSFEVRNGLSVVKTFTDNLPQSTEPNGSPLVIQGTQIAVLDTTTLGAFDDYFLDLQSGMSSTLRTFFSDFRQTEVPISSALGYAPILNTDEAVDVLELLRPRSQVWSRAFGSFRRSQAHEPTVGSNVMVGGLLFGANTELSADIDAGAFVGISASHIGADYNSQHTGISNLSVGLNSTTAIGNSVFHATLAAGVSHFDRTRYVANNTVSSGIETATAQYLGWFIAPEITATMPIDFAKGLSSKTSASYIGAVANAFGESGASDNLSIDARQLHLLDVNTQLNLKSNQDTGLLAGFDTELFAGLGVRAQVGDKTVTGNMLGEDIAFDPYGAPATGYAFTGFHTEFVSTSGASLYFSAQARLETSGSLLANTKIGFRSEF